MKILRKYSPESRKQKADRLKNTAREEVKDKKQNKKGDKPINLKYGLNHVTYLIEPAPPVPTTTTNEPTLVNTKDIKSTDDTFLTYCIDISGSMDTQIPSNNEQYMTRLNGVKIACLENLNILKDSEPNKKCSLVTFSDSIKYYGDGSKSNYEEPLINTSLNGKGKPICNSLEVAIEDFKGKNIELVSVKN